MKYAFVKERWCTHFWRTASRHQQKQKRTDVTWAGPNRAETLSPPMTLKSPYSTSSPPLCFSNHSLDTVIISVNDRDKRDLPRIFNQAGNAVCLRPKSGLLPAERRCGMYAVKHLGLCLRYCCVTHGRHQRLLASSLINNGPCSESSPLNDSLCSFLSSPPLIPSYHHSLH